MAAGSNQDIAMNLGGGFTSKSGGQVQTTEHIVVESDSNETISGTFKGQKGVGFKSKDGSVEFKKDADIDSENGHVQVTASNKTVTLQDGAVLQGQTVGVSAESGISVDELAVLRSTAKSNPNPIPNPSASDQVTFSSLPEEKSDKQPEKEEDKVQNPGKLFIAKSSSHKTNGTVHMSGQKGSELEHGAGVNASVFVLDVPGLLPDIYDLANQTGQYQQINVSQFMNVITNGALVLDRHLTPEAKSFQATVDSFRVNPGVHLKADGIFGLTATKGNGFFGAGSKIDVGVAKFKASGDLIFDVKKHITYWDTGPKKNEPKSVRYEVVNIRTNGGEEYTYVDPETGEVSTRTRGVLLLSDGEIRGTAPEITGACDIEMRGKKGVDLKGDGQKIYTKNKRDNGKTRTKDEVAYETIFACPTVSSGGKIILVSEEGQFVMQGGELYSGDGIDNYSKFDLNLIPIEGTRGYKTTRKYNAAGKVLKKAAKRLPKYLRKKVLPKDVEVDEDHNKYHRETVTKGDIRHVSEEGDFNAPSLTVEAPQSSFTRRGNHVRMDKQVLTRDIKTRTFEWRAILPKFIEDNPIPDNPGDLKEWIGNAPDVIQKILRVKSKLDEFSKLGSKEEKRKYLADQLQLGFRCDEIKRKTKQEFLSPGGINVQSLHGGGSLVSERGMDLIVTGEDSTVAEVRDNSGIQLNHLTEEKRKGESYVVSTKGLTAKAHLGWSRTEGDHHTTAKAQIGEFTGDVDKQILHNGEMVINDHKGSIGEVDLKTEQDSSFMVSAEVSAGVNVGWTGDVTPEFGAQASVLGSRTNSKKGGKLVVKKAHEGSKIGAVKNQGGKFKVEHNQGAEIGPEKVIKQPRQIHGAGISAGITVTFPTQGVDGSDSQGTRISSHCGANYKFSDDFGVSYGISHAYVFENQGRSQKLVSDSAPLKDPRKPSQYDMNFGYQYKGSSFTTTISQLKHDAEILNKLFANPKKPVLILAPVPEGVDLFLNQSSEEQVRENDGLDPGAGTNSKGHSFNPGFTMSDEEICIDELMVQTDVMMGPAPQRQHHNSLGDEIEVAGPNDVDDSVDAKEGESPTDKNSDFLNGTKVLHCGVPSFGRNEEVGTPDQGHHGSSSLQQGLHVYEALHGHPSLGGRCAVSGSIFDGLHWDFTSFKGRFSASSTLPALRPYHAPPHGAGSLEKLYEPLVYLEGGRKYLFTHRVAGSNIYLENQNLLGRAQAGRSWMANNSSRYVQRSWAALNNPETAVLIFNSEVLPDGNIGVCWSHDNFKGRGVHGPYGSQYLNGDYVGVAGLSQDPHLKFPELHEGTHLHVTTNTGGKFNPCHVPGNPEMTRLNTLNLFENYASDARAMGFKSFSSMPRHVYDAGMIEGIKTFQAPWQYFENTFRNSLRSEGIHLPESKTRGILKDCEQNLIHGKPPSARFFNSNQSFVTDGVGRSLLAAEKEMISEIPTLFTEVDGAQNGLIQKWAPKTHHCLEGFEMNSGKIFDLPHNNPTRWQSFKANPTVQDLTYLGKKSLPFIDYGLHVWEQRSQGELWSDALTRGAITTGMDTLIYTTAYGGMSYFFGGPVAWGVGAVSIASSFVPDFKPEVAKKMDQEWVDNTLVDWGAPFAPPPPPSGIWKAGIHVRNIANFPHTIRCWGMDKLDQHCPIIPSTGGKVLKLIDISRQNDLRRSQVRRQKIANFVVGLFGKGPIYNPDEIKVQTPAEMRREAQLQQDMADLSRNMKRLGSTFEEIQDKFLD